MTDAARAYLELAGGGPLRAEAFLDQVGPDLTAERERTLADKEGLELEQGRLLADVLADPAAGAQLVDSMLRPTPEALERLDDFRATGVADLGAAHLRREGRAGVLELRNPRHLNAEDDGTLPATEVAVDLVAARPGDRDRRLPRRRRRAPALRRAAHLRRRDQPHAAVSRPGLLPLLHRPRPRLRQQALPRAVGAGGSRRAQAAPRSCGSPPPRPTRSAAPASCCTSMDHVIAERGCPPLPARAQGGDHPRRQQPAAAARGRRRGSPARRSSPGASSWRARRRATCCATRSSSPARWTRRSARASRRSRARASSTPPPTGARCASAEEPLEVFREYMAVYAREQAVCHLSPALVENLERNWNAKERAGCDVERRRASSCARCSSSACAATVGRAARSAVPLGASGCATRACTAAEDIGSLDDLARLPFTEKADLREHYPFGLLAVPRERLVRVHASSGTGGKPTVVGYTPGDLDVWAERDGALHGDGRRAAGHARPQRQRLRAVHRRARLPPRRRAARRDGPAGLRRLDPPPAHAAARPAGAGAVRDAVLRDARSPRRSRPRAVGPEDLSLELGLFGGEPWSEAMREQIERAARAAGAQLLRAVGDHRTRAWRSSAARCRRAAPQRGPLPRRGVDPRRRAGSRGRRGRARHHHADQGGAAADPLPHGRHRDA